MPRHRLPDSGDRCRTSPEGQDYDDLLEGDDQGCVACIATRIGERRHESVSAHGG